MSDLKRNVTEVELGSPDYRVVPLNAREKRLLKAPSAAHFHKLLLELVDGVKLISKEVSHNAKDGWAGGPPYNVVFEYGWDRRKSAAAFFAKVMFKVRLSEHGTLIVDEWKSEHKDGPTLVDCLLYLDRIDDRDYHDAVRVYSTVTVQVELKVQEVMRKAEREIRTPGFRKVLHRWVRMKMKESMRQELAPLLTRYPADALAEHLSALVVEEVHEL